MCEEHNAGYGGKCVTQSDIDELWNLYIEVGSPLTRSMCTVYTQHSSSSGAQNWKISETASCKG